MTTETYKVQIRLHSNKGIWEKLFINYVLKNSPGLYNSWNYRLIWFLSFRKLLETLMHRELVKRLTAQGKLSDKEYGFRI